MQWYEKKTRLPNILLIIFLLFLNKPISYCFPPEELSGFTFGGFFYTYYEET